ncbi:hypothetical protein [Maribacter sp. 2-571]|uniref:hypothetical protein n=1 Tax=Maribacter sp. 2-571 TaxID=3417569 RepID=UPI003D350391
MSDGIRFVKEKRGYFIEEYDRIEDSYLMKTLFWSANEKTYRPSCFCENSDEDAGHFAYHLSYFDPEVFNTLPINSYFNWLWEIITYLLTNRPGQIPKGTLSKKPLEKWNHASWVSTHMAVKISIYKGVWPF